MDVKIPSGRDTPENHSGENFCKNSGAIRSNLVVPKFHQGSLTKGDSVMPSGFPDALSTGELLWLSAFVVLFLLFVAVLGWASFQAGRD
jgi:hypothetical protein